MTARRVNHTDQRIGLRHERVISWRCDGCKGDLESNTSDFREALALLRENHWVARNEGGTWHHYCEDCRDVVHDLLD